MASLMAKNEITQVPRVIILFIYIAFLFVVNFIAFNTWVPLLGDKGFWFYLSLLSLLLGTHLITPYFNKPVDAIAYSIPVIIALLLVNKWGAWGGFDKAAFLIGVMYSSLIGIIAVVSILLKDSPIESRKNISECCRIFSDRFGDPKVIYTIALFIALYIFHRSMPKELLAIGLAWALTVALRPCEAIYQFFSEARSIWTANLPSHVVGEIAAYQTPGIVLVRQQKQRHLSFATPLLINDPQSSLRVGMSLDYVGRDEGVLLRAIEIGQSIKLEDPCLNLKTIHKNSVVKLAPESVKPECKKIHDALSKSKELVGIVAEETSVERLYFEVVQERDIEEGRLVETAVGKDKVLYQIIDGLTKEETVSEKNKFGYARAQAHKIGIWNEKEKKFLHAKWIPHLNAPVYLKSEEDFEPQKNVIGHFPKSNYTVSIKNIHELVTHNTAILGILGVGKTMLGIELVERMIAEGIKVICLDLTDQYAKELSGFVKSEAAGDSFSDKLNAIGSIGKTAYKSNKEEGGSINEFSKAIKEHLRLFLDDKSSFIKVFNPARLEIWKQDGFMFKPTDKPAMATLTSPEVTRIITEAALSIAQKLGMTDDKDARVCLVYEEAHSLVPEYNSVASKGDQNATNGTARAILQGRKYGMGCLLVTQRTANVTKTILNQCNTIFAMRSFDKTGKEFLSDYMGKEYAEKLSLLRERHAVFFGKASSCENPVLIRLNDREDFIKVFRNQHPPPELGKELGSKNDNV